MQGATSAAHQKKERFAPREPGLGTPLDRQKGNPAATIS
jgi:hypothetical protein